MDIVLNSHQRLVIKNASNDLEKKLLVCFDICNAEGLIELYKNKAYIENLVAKKLIDFVQLYLQMLCLENDIDQVSETSTLKIHENFISKHYHLLSQVEYLQDIQKETLHTIIQQMNDYIVEKSAKKGIRNYLQTFFSDATLLGKVCFHLAENKKDPTKPFAFLVTFISQVIGDKTKHLPLALALKQYADNKTALLSLLQPIKNASEHCHFLRQLVQSQGIFQPQFWNPSDTYRFLNDIETYEQFGISVRVPEWWNKSSRARPKISVTVDGSSEAKIDVRSMMSLKIGIAIGQDKITQKEWEEILKSTEPLVLLNGRWIEVDQKSLKKTFEQWTKVLSASQERGISFIEAMRLLSKLPSTAQSIFAQVDHQWSDIHAGKNLQFILDQLKNPQVIENQKMVLDVHLQAKLRPYQHNGVAWMYRLSRLGFGGCLADDMGLGKTIQVISYLLLRKNENKNTKTLLILPTSLLRNWQCELVKFAPSLTYRILHHSEKNFEAAELSQVDIVLTTYGTFAKHEFLFTTLWHNIFLDEAQAIKNHDTKQTQLIKQLNAHSKFVLTGTPVENRLEDLWSLFDFCNPGLLGTKDYYSSAIREMRSKETVDFSSVRTIIQPYILRRMKTDKSIIADLPEKIEKKTFCNLSHLQAVLYHSLVKELIETLKDQELPAFKRNGLVVSYLMKFKQICNHPSQFLSDGDYDVQKSGKFLRLYELCCQIRENHEKVLVFTQFKEITSILDHYLQKIFAEKGFVLHGDTPVKKRQEMVDAFQKESGPSYFILSLKAGGTGLTLTQASHVIHFDRWWNPAVENQATDRAFRIGQRKNVLVHKFVCAGTIEEKIDLLIEEKISLAKNVVEGHEEINLLSLNDMELLKLVSLEFSP